MAPELTRAAFASPSDHRTAAERESSMVAPTKDAAGHVEGYEIFIKYLPQEATAPELKAWFGEAGEIVGDVRLMTNPATGAPPLPAPPLPPPPLPPPPLPPPSPPPPLTPPHLLTGKCKGIGWVTFATEAGHAQAMGWDGSEYGGRRLAITSATKQHTGFRPSMQAPGTHTPALLQVHLLCTSFAPPVHLLCTSCGTHASSPALLQEVLKAMVAPDPAGVYVDATFGRGGHTRGILGALSPKEP